MHKSIAKTLLHCSILLYNGMSAMLLYMVRVTQFHTHTHMCKLHSCSYISVCVCVCVCQCVCQCVMSLYSGIICAVS